MTNAESRIGYLVWKLSQPHVLAMPAGRFVCFGKREGNAIQPHKEVGYQGAMAFCAANGVPSSGLIPKA